MAIEFRCTQCNRLLRTPDGTAGKAAKCPECGAVSTIPEVSIEPPPAPGEPSAPGVPPPLPPGGAPVSPFAPFGPRPVGFDPENPYSSPSQYAPAPAGYAPAPGQIRPTIIDVGDVMARSWMIFKEQWGQCLAIFLVALAVFAPIYILSTIGNQVVAHAARRDWPVVLAFYVVNGLIVNLFSTWLGIGLAICFLRVARGQKAELSDVFRGGPYFLRVFGAGILVGLIVILGLVLCIVPGVILALMLMQYNWLIVDRNVGVIDSLGISREITTGNKMSLFLLWLVQMGLVILGSLACCVGVLAVLPFIALLSCVTYLTMTGQPTADQFMRPAQPAAS